MNRVKGQADVPLALLLGMSIASTVFCVIYVKNRAKFWEGMERKFLKAVDRCF